MLQRRAFVYNKAQITDYHFESIRNEEKPVSHDLYTSFTKNSK
jgi:hypothetical protein